MSSFASKNKSEDGFQKSMLRQSVLRTVLVASMVAMIAFVSIKIGGIAQGMNDLIGPLSTLASQLEEADLPGLVEETRVLVEGAQETVNSAQSAIVDSTQGIDSALSSINEIDFKTLNKAITDLHAVVEPLARLFNR
ncbi:hypothetical protein LJC42_02375 [Eubacteriales bacterium OttesenSCG-928-K08]|nr:hypothetical protein [Eubacteriales bacterium OttesenSCG-928-K08]